MPQTVYTEYQIYLRSAEIEYLKQKPEPIFTAIEWESDRMVMAEIKTQAEIR